MKFRSESDRGPGAAGFLQRIASLGQRLARRWRSLCVIGGAAVSATVVALLVASTPAFSQSRYGWSWQQMLSEFQRTSPVDQGLLRHDAWLLLKGRQVFRYDTFGDQAFWGGQLGLNQTIEGAQNGGIGPGLSPATALSLGLKVDVDALPWNVRAALRAGTLDLNAPSVTLALLKLDAVVGVKGYFNQQGQLASVGITCAICHSTVDDSFAPGIGHRLDGWPNQDLNVGDIIAFAPNLQPFADELQLSQDTIRQVLRTWGPGMYNAELNLDGKALKPDGTPYVTRIPAAYGHLGEDQHTWTAAFGDVTYWNAYVAVLEMHGQGNFNDSRFNNATDFPVAARTGQGHVHLPPGTPDLVTPELAALQYYELSIPAPKAPWGSYDPAAARRGRVVFDGQGGCASCHMPTQFTDAGYNVHTAQELCIDNLQGSRGPSGGGYVTPQLKGLWSRSKRGFYHDGRFPTLLAVVQHYDSCMNLNLSGQQESDLVQYLKSL